MDLARSPLPAWLGYPGLLLFTVFVTAASGPQVAWSSAVAQVLLGPLRHGETSLLALAALGAALWGLAQPRRPVAVLVGFAGVAIWMALGVFSGFGTT